MEPIIGVDKGFRAQWLDILLFFRIGLEAGQGFVQSQQISTYCLMA